MDSVRRKIIAVALLSFFAWNALFGSVGGLLLCLNKSPVVSPEFSTNEGPDCPPLCVSGLAEENSFSDEDSCVDFELKAVELPQVRIDKGESTPALAVIQCATSDVSVPNFSLKEIAHFVQAQAPPELLDTSVLVAQTVNLRL